MQNIIIAVILILILFVAVLSTVKHFRGEGGCCGGGAYKPKSKKLNTIIGKKTFIISGMHCEHCRNRVHEAINSIPDVSGKVKLKKGCAVISYSKAVDDIVIMKAIEKAGYKARVKGE